MRIRGGELNEGGGENSSEWSCIGMDWSSIGVVWERGGGVSSIGMECSLSPHLANNVKCKAFIAEHCATKAFFEECDIWVWSYLFGLSY